MERPARGWRPRRCSFTCGACNRTSRPALLDPRIWPRIDRSDSVWIAPRMRSPVADLLADLDAALTAVHVEWFLFGAQAAILYGVARLTADVDVTARVPARLTNLALIEAMEHRGFRARFDDPA